MSPKPQLSRRRAATASDEGTTRRRLVELLAGVAALTLAAPAIAQTPTRSGLRQRTIYVPPPAAGGVAHFATRRAAEAASIGSADGFLTTLGFEWPLDGGEGAFRRLAAPPPALEAWQFRSADGAAWELIPDANGISVRTLGAKGDGSADDHGALQAAVRFWAPYSVRDNSGGAIYLPPGVYRLGATVEMSGAHGLKIRGAGPLVTEVKASGDYPAFRHVGSAREPLRQTSIRGMTIRGGGKTLPSAHGIAWAWCNGCEIEDVVLYSCRHGLHLSHQWQTYLTDIDLHGSAADNSHIGFYLDATDTAVVDNAVIAHGLLAKDCEESGFRIVNGQGSKWTSCEAGACKIGWHIGDVPADTPPCEWMHFANCLGDSSKLYNFLITPGAAAYVGNMSFVGNWSGNAGIHGIAITSGSNVSFAGGLHVGNSKAAVYLLHCRQVTMTGMGFEANNETAAPDTADVTLSGGSHNTLSSCTLSSNKGTPNVVELNATDANLIVGNQLLNGATINGRATRCHANFGLTDKA